MVIKETPGNLANVRYAWDLRGLQTAAWFTGTGWGVTNRHDGFGRLVSTTSSMGGVARTLTRNMTPPGTASSCPATRAIRPPSPMTASGG